MDERINVGKRSTNFELLRCIAMIMILFQHLGDAMTAKSDIFVWAPNELYLNLMRIFGTIGVNCFVLISGYFLIKKQFSTKKIFYLYSKVFLYGIVTVCMLGCIGYTNNSGMQWIRDLFPILTMKYWYVSMHLGLLLLSPFLNTMLMKLPQEDYFRMLLVIGVLFTILSMITLEEIWVSRFAWFIYLYSVAAYIRIYLAEITISSHKCFLTFTILIFGLWCSVQSLKFLGQYFAVARDHIYYFTANWYLPVFVASLCLFLGCKQIKIQSMLINSWGKATFGIYILHSTVSPFEKLFRGSRYLETAVFLPFSIVAVALVFIVCWGIDLLISRVEKKFLYPLYDITATKIDVILLKTESVLCSAIDKIIVKGIKDKE